MRLKRLNELKEKNPNHFLALKIMLLCYLAIFGIGYMSSNTTAYLSNQSIVSQKIMAGVWEETKDEDNADHLCDEKSGGNEGEIENSKQTTPSEASGNKCEKKEEKVKDANDQAQQEKKVTDQENKESKETEIGHSEVETEKKNNEDSNSEAKKEQQVESPATGEEDKANPSAEQEEYTNKVKDDKNENKETNEMDK